MIMVIGDLPLCNLTKGTQQIYLLLGFSPCVVSKICLVICHLRKKKLSADLRVPSSDPRNNCGMHFDSSSLAVSKVVNCGERPLGLVFLPRLLSSGVH